MTLEERVVALAQAIAQDIKALNLSVNPTKGIATLNFINAAEVSLSIANVSINSNSIVTGVVEVVNDEIFAENFQLQIIKKNGIGFTIFCSPKFGKFTGTVSINYIIQ